MTLELAPVVSVVSMLLGGLSAYIAVRTNQRGTMQATLEQHRFQMAESDRMHGLQITRLTSQIGELTARCEALAVQASSWQEDARQWQDHARRCDEELQMLKLRMDRMDPAGR